MFDAKKIRDLIHEAREELQRYDDLRANTQDVIATLERRLNLLDVGSQMLPLPGVETTPVNKKVQPNGIRSNGASKPNKVLFMEALVAANGRTLSSKEVWNYAHRNGARSESTHPERMTDALLRQMVRGNQIVKAAPGQYKTKGPG